MDKPFFVMLNHPAREVEFAPMVEDDQGERMARFETEQEAREAAENSSLGEAFGFEVFNIGLGL